MTDVTIRRRIDAPAEKVWQALDDFGNTQVYNPAIVRSRSTNDVRGGLGATRHCDIDEAGQKFVEEEITAYDAADRTFTVEIVGGSARPPMERVEADFAVEAVDAGTSDATMTFRLTTKGPIQAVMGRMATGMLRKAGEKVLRGLDHHVRTGEDVQTLNAGALR